MSVLVFDCETTGKAIFHLPAGDRLQPHLVQVGAILCDETFKVRAEMNMIVRPEGFTIPDDAAAIHGITQPIAEKYGLPRECVLYAFTEMASRADILVAHNLDFDFLVMCTFSIRCTDVVNRFTHYRDNSFCTMKAMTPICQLPGNYGDYKWPKLQEAHKHAFGIEFDGAHDAMADVRACLRIYRWIKEQTPKEKVSEPL